MQVLLKQTNINCISSIFDINDLLINYDLTFVLICCLNVAGKQAEFYLHENTRVMGEFRGCDMECSEIFVRNLQTPMGTVPEAILRNGDIIYLDIGDINID